MNAKISNTGFWDGENAHHHHVHSKPLSNWICEFLKEEKNTRIYDMGCGLGFYLKGLEENGFTNVMGFEGEVPKYALSDKIYQQDLTLSFVTNHKSFIQGNVLILEVLEHIDKKYQDEVIKNIISLCSKFLILSWAIEDQPGFGHVNCKNNKDVIDLFTNKGFKYLDDVTLSARAVINDDTWWFKNTLLIFCKV